jgi:superoxide dismutase, Cu-Zn family
MKKLAGLILAGASVTTVANAQSETSGDVAYVETTAAQATFVDLEGRTVGEAAITGVANGVVLTIEVSGLPARQWVSFHAHETGECDLEDAFESAGGHFNPNEVSHGYLAETGPHAGDMPNQYVGEDGVLRASIFNPLVRLEGASNLRGRALIIHDGTDDYATQPSGNAGDRIACARVE